MSDPAKAARERTCVLYFMRVNVHAGTLHTDSGSLVRSAGVSQPEADGRRLQQSVYLCVFVS